MPIENERKFVLDDDGRLEGELARVSGVTRLLLKQAYLDSSGLRIRSIEGPREIRYVFGYKRLVDSQMVEIETDISKIDFERLWKLRREHLRKIRYTWDDGRFHWDTDFFKTDDDRTYFAMAEVEMPEEMREPPPIAPRLASRLLVLVPSGDPRFTSKRLSSQAHAEQLLAEIRTKGLAA